MNPSEQPQQAPASARPKPPAWFGQRYGVMTPPPPPPEPPAPAEFRFECPQCKQHFVAGVEMAGRKLECPSCANKFIIPQP